MIAACYLSLTRNNPRKYTSPLLLDHEELPKGPRLETTSTVEGIEETLHRLGEFFNSLKNYDEIPETVQKAIRDVTAASLKHLLGKGQADYVDIKLNVLEDNIIVTMRDKGKGCTLTGDAELTEALGETCQLQYSQAIGFNNYTLTFDMA